MPKLERLETRSVLEKTRNFNLINGNMNTIQALRILAQRFYRCNLYTTMWL